MMVNGNGSLQETRLELKRVQAVRREIRKRKELRTARAKLQKEVAEDRVTLKRMRQSPVRRRLVSGGSTALSAIGGAFGIGRRAPTKTRTVRRRRKKTVTTRQEPARFF